MTRPERREEIHHEWLQRQQKYEVKLEDHPATPLLRALETNYVGDPNSIIEALEYLLNRARDADVGPP
jgi:hypothetical protein